MRTLSISQCLLRSLLRPAAWAAVFAAVPFVSPAAAQTTIRNVPGMRQAEVHRPKRVTNYPTPLQPNQPVAQPTYGDGTGYEGKGYGDKTNGYGRGYGYGGGGYGYGRGYGYGYGTPVIGIGTSGTYYSNGGYGYPGYGTGYGYGGYGGWSPYYGSWNGNPTGSVYGPLVIPTGALYGPHLLPGAPRQAAAAPAVIQAGGFNAVPANARVAPPVAADDNAARRERAEKSLEFGDKKFAAQAWPSAFDAYRTARGNLPDSAAVHFRLGWMGIVVGKYDIAAASFREGVRRDPKWAEQVVATSHLYGDAKFAKGSHLDALAASARQDKNNTDQLLLLGIFLLADGEPERAGQFFSRVLERTPTDEAAQGFLKFTEALRKEAVGAAPQQ